MKPVAVAIAGLVGFLVLVFAAAGLGGWVTSTSVDTWYVSIRKPAWTPPGSFIGMVWSVLYPAMGIAAWLVWLRRKDKPVQLPLSLWAIQLALNVLWSFLFFGARNPGLAFFELCLLWAFIALTALAFFRVSIPAGLLMVPYAAWVAFAGVLNWAIWRLNA